MPTVRPSTPLRSGLAAAASPGGAPLGLLGHLDAPSFMKRHWHKRPLLVRQAVPGAGAWLDRKALLTLAARDEVESRLVRHTDRHPSAWTLQHGPVSARQRPPLREPAWTILVQGVDLHVQAAHELLQRFSFIPQARLDDVMVSYASDGGGVGAHLDSYDVFLLQLHGRRRWRWGPARQRDLVPGVALKLLQHFEPTSEAVLEPGDMLYLPPQQAHEGVAVGPDCMTCSIGFRAPTRAELATEILARLAEDGASLAQAQRRYRDADQPAQAESGAIPPALLAFGREAVAAAVSDQGRIECALGEYLSEPKANVWFEPGSATARVRRGRNPSNRQVLRLDRRSRMLYTGSHVFINGDSHRVAGSDARLLRRLADRRELPMTELDKGSADLRAAVQDWCEQGWAHQTEEADR